MNIMMTKKSLSNQIADLEKQLAELKAKEIKKTTVYIDVYETDQGHLILDNYRQLSELLQSSHTEEAPFNKFPLDFVKVKGEWTPAFSIVPSSEIRKLHNAYYPFHLGHDPKRFSSKSDTQALEAKQRDTEKLIEVLHDFLKIITEAPNPRSAQALRWKQFNQEWKIFKDKNSGACNTVIDSTKPKS